MQVGMDKEKIDVVVDRSSRLEMVSSSSGRWRLHLTLVGVQVAFSGFEVLSRLALDNGAEKFAFSFYRNCVAFLVLGFAALVMERKKLVSLTPLAAVRIFFMGLIGVTVNQVLYLTGLELTSAVFASTLRNCIPVITFLLALLSRKEKLNLKSKYGLAKLAGCALGVCGSVLLSLYKGPLIIRSSLPLFHADESRHLRSPDLEKQQVVRILTLIRFKISSWTLGALCLTLSCIAFSSFLVFQVPMLHSFPAPISFASLCCFSSLIQLPILAALFEPHRWSRWKKIPSTEALSIAYAGVVASGFVSAAQSWGVHRGGPVIVAAYQPVETVITAFLGLIFLREDLHLGSVLGALVVVTGLYLLIWGQRTQGQSDSPPANRRNAPQFGSKSSSDFTRVFPEPDFPLESRKSASNNETPGAVSVSDIFDESKQWRVYTVDSSFQEIDMSAASAAPSSCSQEPELYQMIFDYNQYRIRQQRKLQNQSNSEGNSESLDKTKQMIQ